LARETQRPLLLIVDDELGSRQLLADLLTGEGYGVVTASSGGEALARVADAAPDLILLDVQMPSPNGLEVCRRLRERQINVPIIFVTARAEEVDEVAGIMAGADYYITKPFKRTHVKYTVMAALRRPVSYQHDPAGGRPPLRWRDLTVDEERFEARLQNRRLPVSRAEFQILAALVKAQGRVVTRSRLLEEIWEVDAALRCSSRTIDLHVSHLRDILGEQWHLIETVRGIGYRMRSEEEGPGGPPQAKARRR
jgi:DNA-binding response OmpR family regulator